MATPSQLDNENGSHRENRLSVASRSTTGRQNIRFSVNQREKIGHLRLVSQNSIRSSFEAPPTPPPKALEPSKSQRRGQVQNQEYMTKYQKVLSLSPGTRRYTRPSGPELVNHRQPSCVDLPGEWNAIHDRFIAYLWSHCPLDGKGRVPRSEEKRDRWKSVEIATMVIERFPELDSHLIKPSAIEMRLILLDEAGDNDYFQMKYGAYRSEEWGRGI
ncbi:hypothetical protein HYALB_00005621 [Hymenoscyphus albidus]|uniref:Uncharacterized protein n=1 Tax=Hymenoscyphus albidus TaxID=595503 RepID=A0A9N9PUH6_9HELO|nr:hypothetical protein HYALB_00005621 [Hymenoscyphus albidus]